METYSEKSTKKESKLKHFFSPIRKKNLPSNSQPDLFISNVVPNNMPIQQSSSEITHVNESYSTNDEISNPVISSFQVI